jgi:hypothetical protein
MVIDPLRALVLEQYVYDVNGTLLASAVAESFYFDAVSQVALPERVTIRLPTSGVAFRVDLGRAIAVNRQSTDPGQMFAMPTYQGAQVVDLGGALPGTPLPGVSGGGAPMQPSYAPSTPINMAPSAAPGSATTYPPAGYPTGQLGSPTPSGRL